MTTTRGEPLPQVTGENLEEVKDQLQEIVNVVEARLVSVERSLRDDPYTVTNLTTTRSLDVTAATTSDVAEVLGTLIQDLIDANQLVGERRFD
jgi:hypothetical protein